MRTPPLVGLGLLCVALTTPAFTATPPFSTDLITTGDTYIQGSSPSVNFGSSGITAVAVDRITLLQFDPGAIAQSSGPRALLKIKVLLAKNYTDGVTAHLVTSSWTEKSVTAKSLPSIAGAVLDQKTITAANLGQVVSFDVSGALAGWRSNPATNFGIALVAGSPTPNLQLGSREGGSPAVLSLGGVVADNDVTVAVSGGDYSSPAIAANNAFQGDKWCVSPQPGKPCTIHVKAGIYGNGVILPAGLSLVGEGRGTTILVGGLGFNSSGLVSDLSIQGRIVASEPAVGIPSASMELDRVSINSRDEEQEDIIDLFGATLPVTFRDSDISAISTRPGINVHAFRCPAGQCTNLRLVHCRVTATSQGQADGFLYDGNVYVGTVPKSLDIEDTSMFISGGEAHGIFSMAPGLDVTFAGGEMVVRGADPQRASTAIEGDQGGESLAVINAAVIGGIVWFDSGPVTLDGSHVDALSVDSLRAGATVSVSILRSGLQAAALQSSLLTLESSVVAGDLSLLSSKGTLSSAQVGNVGVGAGTEPSNLKCIRVFDNQLNLYPPNCVRQ